LLAWWTYLGVGSSAAPSDFVFVLWAGFETRSQDNVSVIGPDQIPSILRFEQKERHLIFSYSKRCFNRTQGEKLPFPVNQGGLAYAIRSIPSILEKNEILRGIQQIRCVARFEANFRLLK